MSEKHTKTPDHTKRGNSNVLAHGSDYASSYGDIIASGVTERERGRIGGNGRAVG